MIPFDTAPMTSYQRLIVTVGLFHTVYKINVDLSRKSQTFPHSRVFNGPTEGLVSPRN